VNEFAPDDLVLVSPRYLAGGGMLATLAAPGAQTTLQKQLDAIEHHSRIRVHLHDAAQALTAARACLHAPHQPAATPEPTPPHAPATGIRHRPRP
jgi:hypothetical protein